MLTTDGLLDVDGDADSPGPRTDFTDWPVPVGRVLIHDGLTFVHSSEPAGFSADDFRQIPERRVELLDGVAVLKPKLTPEHRQVMADLYRQLCETCPEHLVPSDGYLDVQVGPATIFRPDIQLLSPADKDAPRALVVEARPNRERYLRCPEWDAKLRGFRDVGAVSYWVVDPAYPSIDVYELKYLKRNSFRLGEVCAKRQWHRWGVWARTP